VLSVESHQPALNIEPDVDYLHIAVIEDSDRQLQNPAPKIIVQQGIAKQAPR